MPTSDLLNCLRCWWPAFVVVAAAWLLPVCGSDRPGADEKSSGEFLSHDLEDYTQKLRESDSTIPDTNYLRTSGRPNVFREYIHKHLDELADSSTLDFLEQKLNHSDDNDIQMQCGMILYRYGRAAGENHLLSQLALDSKRAVPAATALVMNQEVHYLPQVSKSVLRLVDDESLFRSSHARTLIDSLGDWKIDSATEILLDIAARHGMGSEVAMALAKHGVESATGEIEKERNRARGRDPYHLMVLRYDLALYLLTGDEQYLQEIRNALESAASESKSPYLPQSVFVAESLGRVKMEAAATLLRVVLETLVSTGDRELPKHSGHFDLLKIATVGYGAIVEELSPESAELLVASVRLLEHNEGVRTELAQSLGFERLEKYPELEESLDSSTIQLARATAHLKAVPPVFVPDKSRPVLRYLQPGTPR